MEKLIESIKDEAGISKEQAKLVVELLTGAVLAGLSDDCRKAVESRFGVYSVIEGKNAGWGAWIADAVKITEKQAEAAIDVYVNFLLAEMSGDCGREIEGMIRGAG